MSVEIRGALPDDFDSVTIRITAKGGDDVYRLLWLLLNGQVEFSALAQGSNGFPFLRRAIGTEAFDYLDGKFTGGQAKRYATKVRSS